MKYLQENFEGEDLKTRDVQLARGIYAGYNEMTKMCEQINDGCITCISEFVDSPWRSKLIAVYSLCTER